MFSFEVEGSVQGGGELYLTGLEEEGEGNGFAVFEELEKDLKQLRKRSEDIPIHAGNMQAKTA